MKKRMLNLLCVLALCLGLLPVTALAAGENAPKNLYVGNQNVKGGDDTTYWTTDDSGALTQSNESAAWNVKYDPNSATLTLREATIVGENNYESVPYGAGIYAECSSGSSVSLTIELIGNSTITGSFGIRVDAYAGNLNGQSASLTIQKSNESNESSLTVTGTSSIGIYMNGGSSGASLNINNVSVTASSESYDAGVSVMTASANSDIAISVEGGSLTASGNTSFGGIRFVDNSGSEDSNPRTSLTVSSNAIVKAINGIRGSSVDAPTPTGTGIVFDGTEGTVYGNVELQKDLEIKSGETLTIPKGSTLNTNKNLTNNGTINVQDGGTVSGSLTNGTTLTTPSISQQPQSTTVTADRTAEFSITASAGEGEQLTYQWQQKATDTGSEWEDISNATTASYTTAATTTDMSGYQYRCVVTSASGVSVTSDVATLTVTEPTTYTITANADPSEGGTVTAPTSAAADDTVTLSAKANQGYRFTGWTFSDNITDADSSSANTTFTMPAGDVTVTANFEQYYTITVNASGGGTATADKATAAAGETVTLTATADSGYHFARWEVKSGSAVIRDNSFTMPGEPVVIRAVFERNVTRYPISFEESEHGAVKAPTRAEAGETVTITVTPDEGYMLGKLTITDYHGNAVDCKSLGGGKYSFEMPRATVTIQAVFVPAQLPFVDVKPADWFYEAVAYVYESGLMDGVGGSRFAPSASTTRAMLVTILWRLEGEPEVDYAMTFADVADHTWYTEAVRWAASEGIVEGYSKTAFGSSDPITREQLAAILYRYAKYLGADVSVGEDTNILSYIDAQEISEYAVPAIQWACGTGLLQGSGGALTPKGDATRAQVATMLLRWMERA